MTDDILKAVQDSQNQPNLPPEPSPIPPTEVVVPPAPQPTAPTQPTAQPKKSNKAPLVAILLFFLLSIPTFVYILGQRQKVTTTPSQAAAATGQSCQTAKGWKGTCLPPLQCEGAWSKGKVYDEWACDGAFIGCCAVDPNSIIGTSCKTTEGWKGTCQPLGECDNRTKKDIAYEEAICGTKTDLIGCCANQPAPTPKSSWTNTTPTIKKTKESWTDTRTTVSDTGSNTVVTISGARCTPTIGNSCNNHPDQKFQGTCVFYHCPTQERCGAGLSGCGESSPGVWLEFAPCSELNSRISTNECAQVDTVDTNLTYCVPSGGCDVLYFNCSSSCTPGKPKPIEPPRGPQCNNIKIYKDGSQVTDLPSLKAGNQVVIAVAGSNAAKARIRIKEGGTWKDWTETSTKNSSGEYTLNYTLPDGVTSYIIEAEVYQDGTWK